jgi:serine/threonine-protein kinase
VVQPQPVVQQQPAIQRPKSRFTLSETLISAGFTGFEGALVFSVLGSIFDILGISGGLVSGISVGLVGMTVGGLIYTQYRRIIEGKDLPILAGITLVLSFILAFLADKSIPAVIVAGVLAGAGVIAITALFRLIYLLLSRWL